MKKNINLRCFRNLVYMTYAGGKISLEEEIILHIKRHLGISDEDFNTAVNDPESIEYVLPESLAERGQQMEEIIAMMSIGGELLENDKKLCLDLASWMEIPIERVEKLITGSSISEDVSGEQGY